MRETYTTLILCSCVKWCPFFFSSSNWVNGIVAIHQGSTNFSKTLELPPDSKRQIGDMKQAPYWRPTMMEWPVNLSYLAPCVRSVWNDNIFLFVRKQNCNNYAEVFAQPYKIQSPGRQVLGICAPLLMHSVTVLCWFNNNSPTNARIFF